MTLGNVSPVHKVPLFDRSKKRLQQQQREEEEQHRVQVIEAVYQASRTTTYEYICKFLETSKWKDQFDQISIAWDALPPIHELESFGHLNQTEGTKACRRLFKAVVIWDELGHSLWEKLKNSNSNHNNNCDARTSRPEIIPEEASIYSESRRSSDTSVSELGDLSRSQSCIMAKQNSYDSSYVASSEVSQSSSRRSSNVDLTMIPRKAHKSRCRVRRSFDLLPKAEPTSNTDQAQGHASTLVHSLPKFAIPRSCTSIVRKTMGAFVGDGLSHRHSENGAF